MKTDTPTHDRVGPCEGTHGERFGQLRSLLHQAPTRAAWDELAALLLTWDDGALRDEILPYVERFVDHRWASVSHVPPVWLEAASTREDLSFFTLAARLTAPRTADAGALLARVVEGGRPWSRLHTFRGWRAPHTAHTALPDLLVKAGVRAMRMLEVRDSLAHAEELRASLAVLRPRVLLIPDCSLDCAGLVQLLQRDAPGLRVLDVSHVELDGLDEEASAVFRATSTVAPLRALVLERNLCESPFLEDLASSPLFANVRHLHLADNLLDASGVEALSRSPHLRLHSLNLTENEPSRAYRVLDALSSPDARSLTHLRHLCISACNLGSTTVDVLASAPWRRTLRTLNLSANGFLGAEYLDGLLWAEWPVLTSLDLSQCLAPDELVAALVHSASRWPPRLRHLALCNTRGGQMTLAQLARVAWPAQLRTLDLRGSCAPETFDDVRAFFARRHPDTRVLLEHDGAHHTLRTPLHDRQSWPRPEVFWTRWADDDDDEERG